eukprot:765034-Prymnesium_polylepis.1
MFRLPCGPRACRGCHFQLDGQWEDTSTRSTAVCRTREGGELGANLTCVPQKNLAICGWADHGKRHDITLCILRAERQEDRRDWVRRVLRRPLHSGCIFHGGDPDFDGCVRGNGTARVALKEFKVGHGNIDDRRTAIDNLVSVSDDGTSSTGIAGTAARRQLVQCAAPGSACDHSSGTI